VTKPLTLLTPYDAEEYKERLRTAMKTANVKAWLEGSWDMITDDRSKLDDSIDPATGQQRSYLVLSDEELAKGFKRPVRTAYIHQKCGGLTSMGAKLSETYARDPDFYSGTFCVQCAAHFSFKNDDGDENPDGVFHWDNMPKDAPTAQLGFEVYK
jgi:hypothetical protein